ncbi:MAG: hypothetical protein K2K95_07240 [Muribaculaceae bacterium]|nr:hypothetical protein [Muribaculaceae bacterium]
MLLKETLKKSLRVSRIEGPLELSAERLTVKRTILLAGSYALLMGGSIMMTACGLTGSRSATDCNRRVDEIDTLNGVFPTGESMALTHCESVPERGGETVSEAPTPTTVLPTGDPEKDWIFVQQAVDAWLYFHLSDFKSYEPLRRSTDYDSIRDIYIHHLRYRSMNEQGGMITVERDYEVDLNRQGDNGNPFFVKEK